MRVAVVGAGPSGLAAARTFRELGLDVTVYEAVSDVGGVWSASRSYPGIATQNDKATYTFSDLALPAEAADVPTGREMREYLHTFIGHAGLEPHLRLSTRVSDAEPLPDGGWSFLTHGPAGERREHADWLVVANGLHSTPYVPAWAGCDEFANAGGRLVTPGQVGSDMVWDGRDVVVVGFGKSAADIAADAAATAGSVHVIARNVGWKLPRAIAGVSFQRVILSRLGEFVLWGGNRSRTGRVARKITQPLRRATVRLLGALITRQLRLTRRGVRPDVPADQLDHLITDGFLEAIDDGSIEVHRGRRVASLAGPKAPDGDGGSGSPRVVLDDETVLPADVVVAATGYDPDLGLFTAAARENLVDRDGDLVLARFAIPAGVPGLAFVGWVNSFRNPINAEIQSLWVAAVMLGLITVPEDAWRDAPRFRQGHEAASARGVQMITHSGSFLSVDAWLQDLDLRIPAWRRRREVFGPLIPSVYADRLPKLAARLAAAGLLTTAQPLAQAAAQAGGHE